MKRFLLNRDGFIILGRDGFIVLGRDGFIVLGRDCFLFLDRESLRFIVTFNKIIIFLNVLRILSSFFGSSLTL